MSLSPADRRALLRIARMSIRSRLESGRIPEVPVDTPGLSRKAGCFVSLHAGEDLRGCVGTFREDAPVARAVAEMAVAAAFEDPRFPPVAPEELPDLDIEISVLTPRRRIDDPSEIEVGRHGLWIERGARKGVLLPQVASREGWDRETFLAHTCLKAGLSPDAWRQQGTSISVFEAEVFGEKDERDERGPR